MEIKIKSKNKDFVALVSTEDYELVSQYKWHLDKCYAKAKINGKSTFMHSLIMNAKKGQMIDHINRIKLDNQRNNLIFSNPQKNSENRTKKPNTSSTYFGVSYEKKNKKFRASFVVNKIRHSLGCYVNEIDAAEAIDKFIVYHNLDHKSLNFPEKRKHYLSLSYTKFEAVKTSKYIGVQKLKNGMFLTKVAIGEKSVFSFRSNNEKECAEKYDEYVVNNNLINRKLNFPENYPEYFKNKIIKTFCEYVDDKTVRLLIGPKDKIVLIDLEDYDKIKYYSCNIRYDGYVQFKINREPYLLHRYLMGVTDPLIYIDHFDSDGLNNCKSNLRFSDAEKNPQNRKKNIKTTSKYLGVSLKKSGGWKSNLAHNNKDMFNLEFGTEEKAARYRDLYIINNLPDTHYKLNFKWNEQDIKKWQEQFKYTQPLNTINRSSQYMHVSYKKSNKQWVVCITKNKKTILNQGYNTEELAARKRDLFIMEHSKELNGNRCKLYFEWNEDLISYWTNKTNKI
jgi:hypothetical protein